MIRELKGWHVLVIFLVGFGTIIAVNLTLAVQAIATFPGLETPNSYVASQRFDAERRAQQALGWKVSVTVRDGTMRLSFRDAAGPVHPVLKEAAVGRATIIAQDRSPDFVFDGTAFVAPVDLDPGNWDLRLVAEATDGTMFHQRLPVRIEN